MPLTDFMNVPSPENRMAVILVQPNGSTALLLDGAADPHTSPEYMDMLFTLKNTDRDAYELADELEETLVHLDECEILVARLVFPGVPANEVCDEDSDGYPTFTFNGDIWEVDSIIETEIPIV